MITLEQIKAVMIGHAIGDALGVPVEFCEREELKTNPVVDMRGYGTYPVPAGSWSDDTSMSIAALDSLAKGTVNLDEIMDNFVEWVEEGKYTPTGKSFDMPYIPYEHETYRLLPGSRKNGGEVFEYPHE